VDNSVFLFQLFKKYWKYIISSKWLQYFLHKLQVPSNCLLSIPKSTEHPIRLQLKANSHQLNPLRQVPKHCLHRFQLPLQDNYWKLDFSDTPTHHCHCMGLGKKQLHPPKNQSIKSHSYFTLLFLLVSLHQVEFSSKTKYQKCNNPLRITTHIHSANFLK